MKKFLSFVVLSVLFILALAACAPVSGVIDRLVAAPVSAAQAAQPQSVPAVLDAVAAAVTPTSAASQQMTGVQLVVYGPDRSIRIVDVAVPLNSADKPAFNGLLPGGGSASGTAYVLDTTGVPKVVAVDALGTRELSFIKNPTYYGLAVWQGASGTQPRLAWGTQPTASTQTTSLQISAIDGSQLETLLTQDANNPPLQLTPEFWSADGQYLYFSKEPVGLGGYILFGGASNLYQIDITTKEVTAVIPSGTSSGPQVCLDDISGDYRTVADHCSQKSITVRDLVSGGTTTILPPREVSELIGTLGSARFSPDGRRLAFALARRNPDSEQGWVAVSDGLSGESKLILTSPVGTYYTVAGWLDSQTLLVQSTNLLNCSAYCSGELWAVRIDGTYVQKVADGSLITVITAEVRPVDSTLPTPVPPTPVPPTFTPTPRPATPTATPEPCNLAEFVKDVTVKDGALFAPGEDFIKTWRLENVGTCTWTKNYELVFRSGDRMDGPSAVSLGEKVKPGDTIDISVELTAPDKAGEYTGYWALRDDTGRIFGIGAGGTKAFWVSIEVTAETEMVYDFTANYCDATWSTGMLPAIPCPGPLEIDLNVPLGSVTVVSSPMMETGYMDDEPALVTYPDRGSDGYIRGQFPAVKIKDGDHFKTIVGCLYESWKCSVTLTLSYSVNGGEPQQLGRWTELYDNEITRIDIDLSFLAGKKVEFIFTTRAKDTNEDDWAFWLMPRIVR